MIPSSAANLFGNLEDPKGLTCIWPLNYENNRETMICGIEYSLFFPEPIFHVPNGFLYLRERFLSISSVVAIHGLNGGSFRTWTEAGILWIRDLLCSKLPSPRIMTFGYNANLYSDCAAGRIKDFAHNLYSMLEDERETPQERSRPILFICHSMGGLVLKRALVIANGKNPKTSILRSPGGIVFLATPHRGSKSAIWAEIGTRMLKAVKLGTAGTSSAKELKFFSTTVQDIEEDFVPLSSKFKIVSFFEQKGYPGLGLIVEATSAKMQVPSELHTIGLDVTHDEMSHFPNANDDNYKIVERNAIESPLTTRKDISPSSSFEMELVKRSDSQSTHSTVESIIGDFSSTSQRPIIGNQLPPFVPRAFTGREDVLSQICEHLQDDSILAPAFGLWGCGGVGKTQIALKYISENFSQFSAIFWIYADTTLKLMDAYDTIAKKLGMDEKLDSTQHAVEFFKSWLQNNSNWLLVFDNVDDLNIISPYWPTHLGNGGSIIVTSRDPGVAARSGPLTGSAEVACLSEERSTEMLWSQLDDPNPSETHFAVEIARRSGGLPLAINHMASYISQHVDTLEEFLDIYDHNESLVVEDNPTGANFTYEHNLATAWLMSITVLHKEALQLLDLLSLFDPDEISLDLIKHFTAPRGLVYPAIRDRDTQLKAVNALTRSSLAKKAKGKHTKPFLSIHRFVQSSVRRQWTKDPTRRHKAFSSALFCLNEAYSRQEKCWSMVEFYPRCAQYTSHLLSLMKYYNEYKDQFKPDRKLAELLVHCGRYLFERGQGADALTVLRIAEDIQLSVSLDNQTKHWI